MSPKIKNGDQPSLFDVPIVAPRRLTDRELYIEQIRRDMSVLREDPEFWVPTREFYEQRIEMCREAIRRLDLQVG